MGRKEELEKIIADAETELEAIRRHVRLLRDLDEWLPIARDGGVTEEEILGLVDIVYHPDHYLTDAD